MTFVVRAAPQSQQLLQLGDPPNGAIGVHHPGGGRFEFIVDPAVEAKPGDDAPGIYMNLTETADGQGPDTATPVTVADVVAGCEGLVERTAVWHIGLSTLQVALTHCRAGGPAQLPSAHAALAFCDEIADALAATAPGPEPE